MADKVKIGIVGADRIGRLHTRHLPFRIKNAQAVAVSHIITKTAEGRAAARVIESMVTDHRRIMENTDIDAVVVCLNTSTYAQIIEEAAEVVKHIFCEKPIDFDLRKIDRAVESVDRGRGKLQVGFNRRFDPNFRRI